MIDEPRRAAPRLGAPVVAYFLLTLVPLVALAVAAVPGVRPEPGVIPLLDDWLHLAGYLLATGAVVWRVARYAEQRLLWSIVAVALLLRTTGFAWTFFVLERAPVYPSFADLAWVLSALALLAGLLVAASPHRPRGSATLALDALLAGIAAAAVAAVLLDDTLRRLTSAGIPADALATNLAYPLVDVALIVVVAALAAATRSRMSVATCGLCLGVVVFAVIDCVFLYQVSTGSFRPGSYLTSLSLAGSVLIAVASWASGRDPRSARLSGVGLVTPLALALVCVAVLAYDAIHPVPAAGIVLGSGGVLLAILRGYLTQSGDRRVHRVVVAAKDQEIERFQSLVEASDDFIAIARVDGRLSYLNPAGKRMVGLPEDLDVTGTTVGDYVPALTKESLAGVRPGLVESGTWRGDSELIDHGGGPPIPVTANTFLLPSRDGSRAPLMATVQRDISELRAAETALQQLADERKTLLAHLVDAQEAERARIAADVHDDSVQALAVVDLQLGLLRSRLSGADVETLEVLEQVRDSVGTATERLRHLLFDLDSPAQRGDLFSALEEAASVIFEGSTTWQVLGDREVDLPEPRRIVAHRMAKEAMVNIKKHAHAATVSIEVRRVGEGVEVAVSDDGIGLDPAQVELRPGHRGLADMRDRATIAGGWVTVDGRKEQGSTVRIWLPASADPA